MHTAWNACSAFSMRECLNSVDRLVGDLPAQQPAFQLPPQQAAFPLRTLHEAAVLLGSAGQVGDDLIHGAVGNILVHGESCLTWIKQHRDTVDHWFTGEDKCLSIYLVCVVITYWNRSLIGVFKLLSIIKFLDT